MHFNITINTYCKPESFYYISIHLFFWTGHFTSGGKMRIEMYIYRLLFIIPALIIIGCSDKVTPTFDQTYSLRGKVVNSLTGKGVGKVTIGMKNPSAPDSLVFMGDSLNSSINNAFLMKGTTDSAGFYQLDWFLGNRSEERYKGIFAYKEGYRLWLFSKDSSAVVNQINEFTDELNINLVPD